MFIMCNRFTSTKYPYNPEIKSTTYHKIIGHDFLADNGKKEETLTNYFRCCQCVVLLLCKSLWLCCYGPAQIKFQRNGSDRYCLTLPWTSMLTSRQIFFHSYACIKHI